jgi:hypothetical protein
MRDGRRELAGYDVRVFVSWNEVFGGRTRTFRVARLVAPVPTESAQALYRGAQAERR